MQDNLTERIFCSHFVSTLDTNLIYLLLYIIFIIRSQWIALPSGAKERNAVVESRLNTHGLDLMVEFTA